MDGRVTPLHLLAAAIALIGCGDRIPATSVAPAPSVAPARRGADPNAAADAGAGAGADGGADVDAGAEVRADADADVGADLGTNADAGGPQTPTCPPPASSTCVAPAPSFANIVLPIFNQRCNNCHDLSIPNAPWPLDNYADVSAWTGLIVTDLLNCTMPPADGGTTLPESDRQLVFAWLACGAPNN